ncbi:MAG: hypothetical protein ACKVY0_27125 [Prosthecobacter sp.]|uniref:hypothetical protein n=1 Tax=Prosthecobacter sp. TaxID=1965333 RepID=UPI003903FCDE
MKTRRHREMVKVGYYSVGGRILIDGSIVMDAPAFHGVQDLGGTVTLSAGNHTFEAFFFEAGGGDEGEFYAAPGTFTLHRLGSKHETRGRHREWRPRQRHARLGQQGHRRMSVNPDAEPLRENKRHAHVSDRSGDFWLTLGFDMSVMAQIGS